jgi:hypothetical protein
MVMGGSLLLFQRKGYRQFCHVFQLGRFLAQAVFEEASARDHFFFRSLRRKAARTRFTSSTTV